MCARLYICVMDHAKRVILQEELTKKCSFQQAQNPLVMIVPTPQPFPRWFDADEVLEGDFHPALKQAIRDMRAEKAFSWVNAETEACLSYMHNLPSDIWVTTFPRRAVQSSI